MSTGSRVRGGVVVEVAIGDMWNILIDVCMLEVIN